MENLVIEKVVDRLNVKKYTLKSKIKKIIYYLVNNETNNIYITLSEELDCDVTTVYRNIKSVMDDTPKQMLETLNISDKKTNKEFIESIVELVKKNIEKEKRRSKTS